MSICVPPPPLLTMLPDAISVALAPVNVVPVKVMSLLVPPAVSEKLSFVVFALNPAIESTVIDPADVAREIF